MLTGDWYLARAMRCVLVALIAEAVIGLPCPMASSGAPLPTDHPPLTTDGPLSTAEKYAVELDAYRKVRTPT